MGFFQLLGKGDTDGARRDMDRARQQAGENAAISRVASMTFSARVNFVARRMAALKDYFHSCSQRRAGEYRFMARACGLRCLLSRTLFEIERTHSEEGRTGEVDPNRS
jgi:hypothetical protein